MKNSIFSTLFITFIFYTSFGEAAFKSSDVVVSIPPLHSLIQGVMGDTGKAQLLLDGRTSPHDFYLKPSQLQAIQKSKIFFYIHPLLENTLQRVLKILPSTVHAASVLKANNLLLLPYKKHHDDHNNSHEHDESDHPNKESIKHDMHLWLYPANAKKIVEYANQVLSAAYPEHKNEYQKNTNQLLRKIDILNKKLKETMRPIRKIPYMTFHNAYQYFEYAFNLNHLKSLTVEPHLPISPRKIMQINEILEKKPVRCVFSEFQFSNRLIHTIFQNFNVKKGILDPLGADLKAGENLYFELLENLASNLRNCLL